MAAGQVKKESPVPWALIVAAVVIAGAAIYFIKGIVSEEAQHKKDTISIVTLMKPPPLPEIKQKPPEPIKEIPKKEEVVTKTPLDTPNDAKPGGPDKGPAPAGDKLGVDAEGTAGSDAFGLVGNRGGRSILGGGGAGGMGRFSLLAKYAGYVQIVQSEIRKKVMKHLDDDGGIPKGQLQAGVKVSVDGRGVIISYKIVGSSGNNRMDDAVEEALRNARLSLPPPDGMPRTMIIKITSQG